MKRLMISLLLLGPCIASRSAVAIDLYRCHFLVVCHSSSGRTQHDPPVGHNDYWISRNTDCREGAPSAYLSSGPDWCTRICGVRRSVENCGLVGTTYYPLD